MRNKRVVTIGVSAFLAVLLLAGCSSSGASTNTEPGVGAVAPDVNSEYTYEDSAAGTSVTKDGNFSSETGDQSTEITSEEAYVVTGSLSLISENPTETVKQIREQTTNSGGRVQTVEETPGNEYQNAYASLTLRIPADKFDSVVTNFKGLGTVNSYSVESSEVSDQLTDYQVRETVIRGSIERLLQMLNTATDTDTLIIIESTLSQRETELEQILAAKTSLEDQVAFSTLQVTISQPEDALSPEPAGFWDGLVNGWDAFVSTIIGITIAFGFLLPWLVAFGIIGGIVWFVIKKRRKTKKAMPVETVEPELKTEEKETSSTTDER